MKNFIKSWFLLPKKVAEIEKYIEAEKKNAKDKVFKEAKEKALKEWEEKYPPVFKYGDEVAVFAYSTEITKDSDKKVKIISAKPMYYGKIVSLVKRTDQMRCVNFHKVLQYLMFGGAPVDAVWEAANERIYCIDTGDMVYREAGESRIILKSEIR